MIRCPAHQINLLNDNTCRARLAWLDKYDNRTRAILNSMAAFNEKDHAEEYRICRKCKSMEKEKTKRQPKGKWNGKTCSNDETHSKIYASGICRVCYNRAYRQGKI